MRSGCIGRTTGFACVALAACVAGVFGSGRVSLVRVAGGSMSPALWPGDVCLVTRVARPNVSDVVLFAPAGHTSRVLHRVRSLEVSGVVTQGDANPVADREIVASSTILGRVNLVLPVGRLMRMWQVSAGR